MKKKYKKSKSKKTAKKFLSCLFFAIKDKKCLFTFIILREKPWYLRQLKEYISI